MENLANEKKLVEEITYYFDQMKNPIELDLNVFKEEFEREINSMELSNENGLSR